MQYFVRTPTREEWIRVVKICNNNGIDWGGNYDNYGVSMWSGHSENTGISLDNESDRINGYCSIGWYLSRNYTETTIEKFFGINEKKKKEFIVKKNKDDGFMIFDEDRDFITLTKDEIKRLIKTNLNEEFENIKISKLNNKLYLGKDNIFIKILKKDLKIMKKSII